MENAVGDNDDEDIQHLIRDYGQFKLSTFFLQGKIRLGIRLQVLDYSYHMT